MQCGLGLCVLPLRCSVYKILLRVLFPFYAVYRGRYYYSFVCRDHFWLTPLGNASPPRYTKVYVVSSVSTESTVKINTRSKKTQTRVKEANDTGSPRGTELLPLCARLFPPSVLSGNCREGERSPWMKFGSGMAF